MYVATSTGQPPTSPLYVGGTDATIDIYNANNVTIRGISSSKLKVIYGNSNIRIRNGGNIKVDNVDIMGGKSAVMSFDASNVSVTNNRAHGTFGRDWDWADVKERPGTKTMENQAIFIKPLTKDISNIVVDGNDVSGYFNGVNLSAIDDAHYIKDSVISNNLIHDSLDDGIEIDSSYKNLVVKGNTVYDVYSPFSATGGDTGPVDVYENLFIADRTISDDFGAITSGPSYSIKMNNDQGNLTKNMHFYNNTFYFAGNSGNLRKTVQTETNKVTSQVSFVNNIFYSYDGGIVRGTGRAQDGVEWDGNLFYSEKNDPNNYYAWNSLHDTVHSYATLSAIISTGGIPPQWQGNIEGNPSFNCVTPTNASCFRASASITKPTNMQPIPGDFTESGRLNNRTRIGAFE